MCKGPGTIQRAIVATVTELGPCPLLWIAEQAGYDTTKLAVRQSFTRAARKLYGSDAVTLWTIRWGTGRAVTIVSLAEPTPAEMTVAFVRHYETRNPDGGVEFRRDAAIKSLQGTATEGQELVAADTARINQARGGRGWHPVEA